MDVNGEYADLSREFARLLRGPAVWMRENPQMTPIPRKFRKFLAELSPTSKDELVTGIISAANVLRRNSKKVHEKDAHRVKKAAEKTVAKSTRQISSTQQAEDPTTCKICLKSQIRRVTGCGHAFCTHCLSKWMDYSETCPTCRCKLEKVHALYL